MSVINFPQKHKASEVICLKCYTRWVACRPANVSLVMLECPECGTQGYTIETGEDIDEDR